MDVIEGLVDPFLARNGHFQVNRVATLSHQKRSQSISFWLRASHIEAFQDSSSRCIYRDQEYLPYMITYMYICAMRYMLCMRLNASETTSIQYETDANTPASVSRKPRDFSTS